MRIISQDKVIDVPYEKVAICVQEQKNSGLCEIWAFGLPISDINSNRDVLVLARFRSWEDARTEILKIAIAYQNNEKVYVIGQEKNDS